MLKKKLIKNAVILSLAFSSLQVLAESNGDHYDYFKYHYSSKKSDKCLVDYYTYSLGETSITRYQDCIEAMNKGENPQLVKKAKRYEVKVEKFERKIEKKTDEMIKKIKSHANSVFIDVLDIDDILDLNGDQLLLSEAEEYTYNTLFGRKKEKEYTSSVNMACKKLGFDKATDEGIFEHTQKLDEFDIGEKYEIPEDQAVLFGKREGIIGKVHFPKKHKYDFDKKRSRKFNVKFRYFTTLTCERKLKRGEVAPEVTIDHEKIESAIRAKLKAPKTDENIYRVLGLNEEMNDDRRTRYDDFEEEDIKWTPTDYGDVNPDILIEENSNKI